MARSRRLTGAEVIQGLKEGTVVRRDHFGIYKARGGGIVRCPFCLAEVKVHPWSFADSGKRCDCGALLRGGYAYHWASEWGDL